MAVAPGAAGLVAVVVPVVVVAVVPVAAAGAAGLDRLVGVVPALAEVLRLDVADVQEPVAADAEVDERRLDARSRLTILPL